MTAPTILDLAQQNGEPMENGRGEILRLINPRRVGSESVDLHLNRLVPGGPRGRLHRHSHADNVYIVRQGEGTLVVDGKTYLIRPEQVVHIPARTPHSLSNLGTEVLEVFEIYAPAGRHFDFEILD